MTFATQSIQKVPGPSRRGFLAGMFGAGGLLLATNRVAGRSLVEGLAASGGEADAQVWSPDVFLSIAEDGVVSIVTHRSEMGTGIRTSLPMVVADELGADWQSVRIEQAVGDEGRYGSQNTDGSRSIRNFYHRMRQVGAVARTMLEQAAAQQWGVPVESVRTENGKVLHDEKSAPFGSLVALAAKLDVPGDEAVRLKSRDELRFVGKDGAVPITDGRDMTTGRASYGIDARLEGQLFAVIAHPPVVGGKVSSIKNADAVKRMKGVVDVVALPGPSAPHVGFSATGAMLFHPLGGVAVLATNTWAAKTGRDALEIEWEHGANADYEAESYDQALLKSVRADGVVARKRGKPFEDAVTDAAQRVEAEYQTPTAAHAPMEPPAALAEYRDGKCEVWAATQNPQAARATVADMVGLSFDDVTVHVTLLGGGFGRKSKADFVAEAAWLSKQVKRPVLVTWTREDDIQHGYFHSESAMRFEAGLDRNGKPIAWRQRSAFPSITALFNPAADHAGGLELGLGFVDVPFEVPNLVVENGAAKAHMRYGWMRAVSNLFHVFGVGSFIDECAAAAKADPAAYLRAAIGAHRRIDLAAEGVEYGNYGMPVEDYPIDTARLLRVLERVVAASNWSRRTSLPKGRGLGLCVHRSFHCYVANVVEVDVSKQGTVGVPNVWYAVDCGLAVHPDRVRSQFEGSAVFGHSLAMSGKVTAAGGAVEQSNFDTYPVARIHEAPRNVSVDLVEEAYDELPGGVGEPGAPTYSPALCNAIFQATGKRIRRLPVGEHDLSWS